MIVDFRVRPPFKGFLNTALYNPRNTHKEPAVQHPLHMGLDHCRSFEEKSISLFMEEMDEAGIDVGVVMGRQSAPMYGSVPNEDVAELVALYPKRFVGFGGVNGADIKRALHEIDRIVSFGFKGVALDNGWSDPPMYDDDDRLAPIYEKCSELGLIVSLTSSIYVGPDLTYCMPVHIQRVAKSFPNLKIVVPHGGWPWTTEMCAVAFQCRNVHLVPDFYMHIPNMPGAEQYVRAANFYLDHRLLYASSYPVRPLSQSIREFRSLDFANTEVLTRCLGSNALRLLGELG